MQRFPLGSSEARWCCGTLKGVGPAELTFLRELHDSLLSRKTRRSGSEEDTHATVISFGGHVCMSCSVTQA